MNTTDQWRPRVYISGPISKGDRNENFRQACDAQRRLMLAGFAPFNPMLSMLAPFAWSDDMPHDLWVAADLPWVAVADAVLRLPGESVGADLEVAHARALRIGVIEQGESSVGEAVDRLRSWRAMRR